jgi:hypothetical protein
MLIPIELSRMPSFAISIKLWATSFGPGKMYAGANLSIASTCQISSRVAKNVNFTSIEETNIRLSLLRRKPGRPRELTVAEYGPASANLEFFASACAALTDKFRPRSGSRRTDDGVIAGFRLS